MKENLTRHEITHTGSRPYECTWLDCKYSTADHSHVILHIRTKDFKGTVRPTTKKLVVIVEYSFIGNILQQSTTTMFIVIAKKKI